MLSCVRVNRSYRKNEKKQTIGFPTDKVKVVQIYFSIPKLNGKRLVNEATNNDQLTNSKTRVCKTYSPFNQVYQRMYRSH
jgi:hypothetical protein